MTRIALVVSDVDGTLLTKDKVLTDGAKSAVQRLHEAGIGFTIVSSRPTIGMGFLIEPLAITLPIGAFNGSSIVDAQAQADRAASDCSRRGAAQPRRAQRVRRRYLAVHQRPLVHAQPRRRIRPAREAGDQGRSDHRRGFHPASGRSLQDRRRQFRLCAAGSAAKRRCSRRWAGRRPRSVRRTIISTSRRRATTRARSSRAMAKRLGISTDAVATIGDMENDLPMFARSGISFAMGNAADDIKKHATHVTDSNERDGFAARDRDGSGTRLAPTRLYRIEISDRSSFARTPAAKSSACVKDKSRSPQSLRRRIRFMCALIGKPEPVSDRRSSRSRLDPSPGLRNGEDAVPASRDLAVTLHSGACEGRTSESISPQPAAERWITGSR